MKDYKYKSFKEKDSSDKDKLSKKHRKELESSYRMSSRKIVKDEIKDLGARSMKRNQAVDMLQEWIEIGYDLEGICPSGEQIVEVLERMGIVDIDTWEGDYV